MGTHEASTTRPRDIIKMLNSLSVGQVDRLRTELDRARQALEELGEDELAERLNEAALALRSGDLRGFRRAVANVTARLGHLK